MEVVFLKYAELFLRLVLATACGMVIGYERENRNKEAGIRTHAIVALGAALIMIVSKYGFVDVLRLQNYVLDPSRIAAQVVSGVGFLGAGIIFRENRSVSGLTTAAGLWATAGAGMAIGSGIYYVGIPATLLIVCLQFFLHKSFIMKREHGYGKINVLLENTGVLETIEKQLCSRNIEVETIEVTMTENMKCRVELLILYPNNCNLMEVSRIILGCEGVNYLNG